MGIFDLGSLNGEAWLVWVVYWTLAAFFVHRTKSAEGIVGRVSHVLPLYVGLYLMLHGRHPPYFGRLYDNTGLEALGDLLTFSGLLFSVWARVHLGRYWSGIITIKEGHRVIRTGPYELVRHPIYTGMLIAAIGTALTMSTGDSIIGFFIVAVVLKIKSLREEKLLAAELGNDYVVYMREVPALIPYRSWRVIKAAFASDSAGEEIERQAFGAAALQSEQFRIAGTILIVGFLCIVGITRSLLDPQNQDYSRLGVYFVVLLVVGLFEGMMLLIARRADRAGRRVSMWIWSLSTIVECSFPSLVILGLTADKTYAGPYLALVSSPVSIYFLFIVLATIRLNPWLCVLSGAISAAEYLGLYAFTLYAAPSNHNRDLLNSSTYYLIAANMLFAGLLAAGVTRRIRRHVVAALAEAETRRKLDRVEYDLRTARTIQMGLLPKSSPRIEGYDIAGWSQPADQTGGDFYDWIELPGGRTLFIIADAAGHGIGPALLIAACRAYFRAIAQRTDPLELITAQVDALITPDTPDGRFITAAIALLDPTEGKLSVYSAGHGPLYFYSAADNAIKTLDADQPPLGMGLCESPDSKSRVIPLAPGDMLVLMTDGFFEWANVAGDMVGMKRLGEWIQLHHGLAADGLIRRLHEDVLAFAQGTVQADDLTAVVIKRQSTAV